MNRINSFGLIVTKQLHLKLAHIYSPRFATFASVVAV